jgi:phosphate transport system substrate-binding protein
MQRTNIWAGAFALGIAIWMSLVISPVSAQVKPEVDQTLKPYAANGAKLKGEIAVGASETVRQMVEFWAERFQVHHPDVKIKVSKILHAETSGAIQKGVHPIPEGAKLVALSHPLAPEWIQMLKARTGVEPIRIPVALDAIVLVVNHKNPLKGLTLDQVAAMFSEPHEGASAIEQWSHVGVDGKLAAVPLNLYGRDDASGTFAAFRDMALKGAKQRKDVHAQPGSMSVIIEVGTDEAGIGYAVAGLARLSKKVRVVPLARKQGDEFVSPTNETVLNGAYPLMRQLYFYAVPEPDGQVDPIVKQFVSHVLSRDGQALAKDEGFFPLPSSEAEQALRRIESSFIKAVSADFVSQRELN